jgi:hypothetical protein
VQEAVVSSATGTSFEPETIELMRQVLDYAVAKLPKHLRTPGVKLELAQLILKAATGGERDPIRLRTGALIAVTTRHRPVLSRDAVGG